MPRRRRGQEEELDVDDVDMEEGSDEAMEQDRRQTLEDELAVKFVRYALSCEYSRSPIKRQGIRDKVLGEHPRAYKKVFKKAQDILRDVYGMEMQELPLREKLTLEEKRRALQSQTGNKTSETFILVSILPKELREPAIIPPSKVPTAQQEATKVGFYTFTIALICLTGGEITEHQLLRHLSRMNADRMVGDQKTEDVLAGLEKQGYLAKKVEQVSPADDKSVSYLVGPRGKKEVSTAAVADMIRTVYGAGDDEAATQEIEKKIAVSLGLERQQSAAGAVGEQHGGEAGGDAEAAGANGSRRRSGRRSTRANRFEDEDDEY